MMNFLMWNIKGFSGNLKQDELRRLVSSLNLDLICLLETKVVEEKFSSVANNVFP